jgi:hypothetical protein
MPGRAAEPSIVATAPDYYQGDFSASTGSLLITVGNSIQVSSGILVGNVEIAGIASGSGDDLFTATNAQTLCGLYGGAGRDAPVFNAAFAFGVHCSVQANCAGQLDGAMGHWLGTASLRLHRQLRQRRHLRPQFLQSQDRSVCN